MMLRLFAPAASTAVDPRSGLFGFREQLSPMSAVATATRPLTTVASQVLSRSVPHTVPRFRPDDDYSLDWLASVYGCSTT